MLAGNVTSGTTLVDEPAARDFWYYVALVEDACGNVGPVSNRTGGTLNYHLGRRGRRRDGLCREQRGVTPRTSVSWGRTTGSRWYLDDRWNCLDVGPTTNYSVNARPLTDNKVNFEDLMMFAINYGTVSAPQDAMLPVAAATSTRLWLEGPAKVTAGRDVHGELRRAVRGRSAGSVGCSWRWNRAVAEPVSVEAGALATLQNGVVFSSGAGNVDAPCWARTAG